MIHEETRSPRTSDGPHIVKVTVAQGNRCGQCGGELDAPWQLLCSDCARPLPPSLVKACGDQFAYALKLRTGELIRFEAATLHGDYVHLRGEEECCTLQVDRQPFSLPRGIDVRLSAIVWCADAPEGS